MGYRRLPARTTRRGRLQKVHGERSPSTTTPDLGSGARPPAPSPGAVARQVLAPPVRVSERVTARTRAGNGRAQSGSAGLGTRKGLFGAAVSTRNEPGHLTIPRPPPERRSWGHRGRGSELAASPPPAPEWFAPDILIGSSLPFERRAARVARQPLSFGPGIERPASAAQLSPPNHRLSSPPRPNPAQPCWPVLPAPLQLRSLVFSLD